MAANKFNREDGTFSPIVTGDILGTTTSDSAASGIIGEFLSVNIPVASAVALTDATAADIASLPLTGGDWDLIGTVGVTANGTTNFTQVIGWISTTSTTVPTPPNAGGFFNHPRAAFVPANGAHPTEAVGKIRLSLVNTATAFLGVFTRFTVSTTSGYGFMAARRIR